jgi:hypothetical protein
MRGYTLKRPREKMPTQKMSMEKKVERMFVNILHQKVENFILMIKEKYGCINNEN